MPPSRRKVPPVEAPPPVQVSPEEQERIQIESQYADPYEGMEFAPHDPVGAAAQPPEAPQGGTDDLPVVESPFDERYKDDFEGLLFLGALQAKFSYVGHQFVIRTLNSFEYLAAAVITKEYEDTIGFNRAQATILAGLCVVSIDGHPMPIPLGETDDPQEWVRQRFDYASRWYPFTVDEVYQRFMLLEDRTRQVLGEMAKKGRGQGS